VRCNYTSLRQEMLQCLQTLSSQPLRLLTLPDSARTLYTTLQQEVRLGDEGWGRGDEREEGGGRGDEREEDRTAPPPPLPPSSSPPLLILGLESVQEIDHLLTSTNLVRDDFRKDFHFPLVLWVNDRILQKLTRLAPDFKTWAATTIRFEMAVPDLMASLRNHSDRLFASLLDTGDEYVLPNSMFPPQPNPLRRDELEFALSDIHASGASLSADLQASLDFLLGRDAHARSELTTAQEFYERSLQFWLDQQGEGQQTVQIGNDSLVLHPSPLERAACVLFHLGLLWRAYGVLQRSAYEGSLRRAQGYFQHSLDLFTQENRQDMVARFVLPLAEVLQKLHQWQELDTLARNALVLHKLYTDPVRQARDYGFLAEVAIARSQWETAQQQATTALQILSETQQSLAAQAQPSPHLEDSLEIAQRYHEGWYLLLLAETEAKLQHPEAAIAHLEVAIHRHFPQDDPILYIEILRTLRHLYFEQKRYLEAFKTKQTQRLLEHRYNLRAFVGALRLEPQRHLLSPILEQVDPEALLAQEIAASGREEDVQALIQRLGRNDIKLTVIHGPSGVGKSSIVNAGLVPLLRDRLIGDRFAFPITIDTYTNWQSVLLEQIDRATQDKQRTGGAGGMGGWGDGERGSGGAGNGERGSGGAGEVGEGQPSADPSSSPPRSLAAPTSETDARVFDTHPRVSDTHPRVSDTGERVSDTHPRVSETGERVSDTHPRVSETGERVSETGERVFDTHPRVFDTHPQVSDTGGRVFEPGARVSDTHAPISESAPLPLPPSPSPPPPPSSLTAHRRLPVLIFDQFEEFFFVHDTIQKRRPFYEYLRDCLYTNHVKVILSLRQDYLHYLLEFQQFVSQSPIKPGIPDLDNIIDILGKTVRYPLRDFDQERARQVILSLTSNAQFYLEPALLDELVRDLTNELGEVRPIELQVVGAELQAEGIDTLAEYLEKGPKETLVQNSLASVVQDCGRENEEVAWLILFLLTNENGTRPLKTRPELEIELADLNRSPNPTQLDLILEILVGSGLLFLVPETPADRYQLVHDYLVHFIRQQQKFGLAAELERERELRQQAELARQQAEQAREQAEQAREILAEANRQALRKIQIGATVLAASVIGAVSIAGLSGFLINQANDKVNKTEQTAKDITNQAEQNVQLAVQREQTAEGRRNEALEDLKTAELERQRVRREAQRTVQTARQQVQTARQEATQAKQDKRNAETQAARAIQQKRQAEQQVATAQNVLVQANEDLKLAQKGTELERTGLRALRQFEFTQLDALVTAMQTGKQLKALAKDLPLKDYPATSPLLALQTIQSEIRERNRVQTTQGVVWSVSFSPDGRQVATAGSDGTARLWNLSGQQIGEFKGHQGGVLSVSFSPDGRQVATAGYDGTARLWNLSGQQIGEFKGHQGGVWSVSFSPDGRQVATAGYDGTARLFPVLNLDQLLAQGCTWLRDYLANNPTVSEDDRRLCDGITP
jgi:hypothetical protein